MTNHTPTPWKAHGCAVYQADDWREGKNLGGQKIVGLIDDEYPTNQNIANAELIVRAVNSHQSLCDALSAACDTLELKNAVAIHEGKPQALIDETRSHIAMYRQALNQAKL